MAAERRRPVSSMDDAEFGWIKELGDHIEKRIRAQTRILVGLMWAWGAIGVMIIRFCR